MAQHRQSGIERYGIRGSHDMHQTNGTVDHVTVRRRATIHTHKHQHLRRSARSDKARFYTVLAILVFLCLVLLFTVLAYYYIAKEDKETNNHNVDEETDDLRSDSDFVTNVSRVEFGKGSVGRGQDPRYWDKDDRRRDEDYNEDVMEQTSGGSRNENVDKDDALLMMNHNKGSYHDDSHVGLGQRGAGLYNEAGHYELKRYEAKYGASLKKWGNLTEDNGRTSYVADLEKKNAAADIDDDYDDFFYFRDAQVEDYDDSRNTNGEHSNFVLKSKNGVHKASLNSFGAEIMDDIVAENVEMASSLNKKPAHDVKPNASHVRLINEQPIRKPPLKTKGKPRRHKFSGLCEMKLLNSTSKLVEPPECQKFARFNLQYTDSEEKPLGEKEWVPRFAGHQRLEEREKSFLAHDQKINCGFVKGPRGFPGPGGFDLAKDGARYISRCHIAVISCIFGNSDRLRTPTNKTVTGLSRTNVCFVMFIDEVTLQTLTLEGQVPDGMGFIGFWKLVVVKNLPYGDMRRVGKIPKLLPHRLFPSARYSIWLDSKLRLQIDPLLILEYFLWRKGYEFAISNHYDRHCVWEEVARNKKLNKYNNTVIDQQFAFYKADGLQRFNASDPNKLLPSNVPEGSFIIREHTPMSNLFSCLWFNEVDRFTPRDQLSFAYTYQKLKRMNPDRPFHLNMFKDCERRHIAKLFRHRADEKRSSHGKASE